MSDLFDGTAAAPPAPIAMVGLLKGWVPADYMDECCPPCRMSPSDWLVQGDVLHLATFEGEVPPGRKVVEGDVVVFSELTDYPSVQAVWHGPGDYRFLSPIPAGATTFWIPFDYDTIDGSAEDVMKHGEEGGAFDAGETFEIGAYDWSERRFVLRAGRFVEETEVARG